MFKKFIKWLMWITVDSPINITRLKEEKACDYCGFAECGLAYYTVADFTICQMCLKDTFDKV